MSSTARVAWIDAWEGASTPSPYATRGSSQRTKDERYTWQRAQASWQGCAEGVLAYGPVRARSKYETRGSVVHISTVREARRSESEARHPVDARRERMSFREVPAIDNYDWEAAAGRRPGRNECERVILHADRSIEARMSSTHYYSTQATARRPDPRPEATRREAVPRMRVVKRRVPRWRLGFAAGIFAVLFIGLTVIAPIMTSSAVAGMESAVGQAETQQQQLAADTAALSSQISSLSSPQRVAEQAAQLGLGPANEVSYMSSGEQMLASEGDTTVAGR
jgi:cell division protein FtsB